MCLNRTLITIITAVIKPKFKMPLLEQQKLKVFKGKKKKVKIENI